MESLFFTNSWTDQNLFRNLHLLPENSSVFTFANGGDTIFNLLKYQPSSIIVSDINPSGLYLAELKKLAIQEFSIDDCLDFLGYTESSVRLLMFDHLIPLLSTEAYEFWKNHLNTIDKGVIRCGQFEEFLQLFRHRILPLIHSSKQVNELFIEKSTKDQEHYYSTVWNTRLWRIFFKFYFSNKLLNSITSDEQFKSEYKHQLNPFLFQKIEQLMKSTELFDNDFFRYALTENDTIPIPQYLSESNYSQTQSLIERIELIKYSDFIIADNLPKFDFYFLSNSYELLTDNEFEALANVMLKSSKRDSSIYYSQLFSNRSFTSIHPKNFDFISKSTELFQLNIEKVTH